MNGLRCCYGEELGREPCGAPAVGVVGGGAAAAFPYCAAHAPCACENVLLDHGRPLQLGWDGLHTRRACVVPEPRDGDRTLILRDGRTFDRPGLCLAADRQMRAASGEERAS